MSAWTREAVEALGPTTDVPHTAALFGVDKETIYSQIRRGEWTATRVLRLGRKIRIPTRDLIDLLYGPATDAAPGFRAVPSPCQHPTSVQVTSSEPHIQCGCTDGLSAEVRPLLRAT